MIKDEYYVIGVMSGTSLDGIDLVYVKFRFDIRWHFQILKAKTIEYGDTWRHRLKSLVDIPIEEVKKIDDDYTLYLARTIENFIKENQIESIDFVSSHGHTALHQPENGLTYQIGNKSIISEILGYKVVCDFRVQDVKLQGQGAPLVPIGDALLFSDFDICLNLGGFANLSTDLDGKRVAYDICPVNIVLNQYIKSLGFEFDDKGQVASSGALNESLLNALNSLDFYNQNPPKSLGLEWVKSNVFPIIDSLQLEIRDILHTFCEHIALQIAKETNTKKNVSILISGGGVYNDYLIKRIRFHSENKIHIPDKTIIEFKEALIFAFLGVLKFRNEVNCLCSVTGAIKDHSSGVIFHPKKLQ